MVSIYTILNLIVASLIKKYVIFNHQNVNELAVNCTFCLNQKFSWNSYLSRELTRRTN